MNLRSLCVVLFLAQTGWSASLPQAELARQIGAATGGGRLQAVSAGVLQPGGPVTAHAGVLAPDRTTPPDDRTLYDIGSVTKVFTGLLLAEAVTRGELTLDTALAALLPPDVELPDRAGSRITVRMLATHTSGLPRIPVEIPPDDYTNPYAAYGEADLWATLRRVKLDFEPGTKASYSNLAVGLLGTLLARRAGLTYPELLAARITGPLGMKDTVVEPDAGQRARRAPGFNAAGQAWPHWEFKALAGAGAVSSTLSDLMRFAAAMLRPAESPLREAIELAWAKQELAASVGPGGSGLGWMLAGDGRTRWHNGMTGGFHAALFVSRELGVATVVLTNRSDPSGSQLGESLIRRAAGLPERPNPNRDRPEVALSAAQLDRCTGTFRISPAFALVFERRELTLLLTPTGQGTDRLAAAAPDTFFSRRVAAEIVFDLPADGSPASGLTLKQNGREVKAQRE
jgi:CubicO group peptidase (beta-lactamase class C family)